MSELIADWPAPNNVRALTTTRLYGFSAPPFSHNNLGLHVGDNPTHVQQNRLQLKKRLHLPDDPVWLHQTHSNRCIVAETESTRDADAAITRSAAHPLSIMTADCVPIVICNTIGTEIAAIHAGWRGLANGIVENTLQRMHSSPHTLLVWIGPAICGQCYETSPTVRDAYLTRYPFVASAFRKNGESWYADLPKIAELIFNALGVFAIHHSNACTYEQNNTFYSYRRQAETGRMATLIWFINPS